LFENSWEHMWIKILKMTLSSYDGPFPEHGGHVLNLKKHNLYKRVRTCTLGQLAHFTMNAPPSGNL
jgi:hypothetical protein